MAEKSIRTSWGSDAVFVADDINLVALSVQFEGERTRITLTPEQALEVADTLRAFALIVSPQEAEVA